MATVQIEVPTGAGRDEWVKDVSTTLDGGDDVIFVNPDGGLTEIHRMMLSTDGAVQWRPLSMADADAVTQTYLGGGWHEDMQIHKLFAAGTDDAIGLHVKA